MTGFRTRFEDLPSEFAVFPLPGALLLPKGRLPLNIFEPRYLAMTEDSLANSRMFAMIQPNPALPETPNGPSLFRVGCLGRLSSFSETDDGRLLITLTGLARFSIASEIDMRHGYRRVIGDFSSYRADMNPPEDVTIDREGLLDALRGYFARRDIDPNWDTINRLPDEALVVTDSALERAESGIENLGMAATRSGKPASGLRASTEAMPATNNEYGPPGGRIMQALQEAGGRLDVGTLFKSSGFKVADGVSAGERFYEALREAEQIGLVAEDRAGEAVEVVLSSLRAS